MLQPLATATVPTRRAERRHAPSFSSRSSRLASGRVEHGEAAKSDNAIQNAKTLKGAALNGRGRISRTSRSWLKGDPMA